MPNRNSILLIEDSPGECELFRLALVQTGFDIALYTEHDVEAALHFLKTESNLPSLILLDWHLRDQRGDVFLKRLRTDSRVRGIPVIVFTTSDDMSDRSTAYVNGANGYVVKPGTFEGLVRCVNDLCGYWLRWNRTLAEVESTC